MDYGKVLHTLKFYLKLCASFFLDLVLTYDVRNFSQISRMQMGLSDNPIVKG